MTGSGAYVGEMQRGFLIERAAAKAVGFDTQVMTEKGS